LRESDSSRLSQPRFRADWCEFLAMTQAHYSRVEEAYGFEGGSHAAPAKKSGCVKRRRKASSQAVDKASEQEVLLAKPLKLKKKFTAKEMEARTSGLNVSKKASSVKTSFATPWVPMAVVKNVPSAIVERDE
jgi:hypothetical protein